jgi:hypothetical protein
VLLMRGLPGAGRGSSVILAAGQGFPGISPQMRGIKAQFRSPNKATSLSWYDAKAE